MTSPPTISFCDFWPGCEPYSDAVLSRFVDGFTPMDDPTGADLVISSVHGCRHAGSRGTLVSLSYEPYWSHLRPHWTVDWRYRDEHSHCRLPYWAVVLQDQLDQCQGLRSGADPAERKFCNFIYFNLGDAIRTTFFDELNRRKRVDALGRIRNNATSGKLLDRYEAGAMESKRRVQAEYRFTVAFENSQHDGYTTEKIIDAWLSDTVPIYWGNPLIDIEFPPGSYLSLYEAGSVAKLVEMVLEVDESPELYEQYRAANPVRTGAAQELAALHFERLDDFVPRVLSDALANCGAPRRGAMASSARLIEANLLVLRRKLADRLTDRLQRRGGPRSLPRR